MRVTNFDVKNVTSLDDVQRFISQTITQIVTIVNGKATFTDNIDCRLVNVTFTASAVDTQVTHNLGRTTVGYFLTGSSTPMSIYIGVNTGNINNIFVRTN